MTISTHRAGPATAAGSARARDRRTRRLPRARRWKESLIALGYLAPALFFYTVFVGLPWLHSIWISFFNWDGIGAATWAGIDNYRVVFTDPQLLAALRNGLGFIVFYSILPVALGLVCAALIAARKRGGGAIRTILFLPQILPLVAVGLIWRYMYSQDGPINELLSAVGLGALRHAWLGDFAWAYPAVGLIGTWVSTGLCTMLLLSGIQKIDPALYEAAMLDGCNGLRSFRHVTLPGLRSEVVVAITITVISALASFDVVYVTTGGGPGHKTIVPGVLIYQLVFTSNEVGVACALATVLSAVILAFVAIVGRLGRER